LARTALGRLERWLSESPGRQPRRSCRDRRWVGGVVSRSWPCDSSRHRNAAGAIMQTD